MGKQAGEAKLVRASPAEIRGERSQIYGTVNFSAL
jgi:hypothetical protein